MGAFIGQIDKKSFNLDLEVLKKHFIALGSSGSGKTVLCKSIIEASAINKIPSIIIDPQGDLASLALPANTEELKKHNLSETMLSSYKNTQVIIFTPSSSKGIPICINPLKLPKKGLEKEELISILNKTSISITQLLGYKTEKAKAIQSLLYLTLLNSYETQQPLENFNNLILTLENPPEKIKEQSLLKKEELKELIRKIRYLTIGGKELLFQFGVPLDINLLLGKDINKTRISIIYLNTLDSQSEKHFFLSILALRLYQWMLTNPSKHLQALFYIDEIAEYIPAGAKKPITKEILQLIFKQARKYGVGCITSTQNPGDLDYKAFAQFGTWSIGRLTLKQDILKIKDALKSLTPKVEKITQLLPQLKPSEFVFFSPDIFKEVKQLKSRYLLTQHKTLNQTDIKKITTPEIRSLFKFKTPAKLSRESPKLSKPHFRININKQQLAQIIESKKKKQFLLFGPKKENITSLKLIFKPLYQLNLKEIKSSLLRKKINQHSILIDAITGNILKLKNYSLKKFNFSALLNLNETEIIVFKTLNYLNKATTSQELSARIGLTPDFITKTLNSLMKKKLISYSGKSGNAYLWLPLTQLNLPHLNSLSSLQPEITSLPIEAETQKQLIQIKQLQTPLKAYFNSDIIEHKIVYYPFYEVKLTDKQTRILNISAVSGKFL